MIQQYINFFIIKIKENVKIGTLFPTLIKKKFKKKTKKKKHKALLGRIK